ncbi:MAG TPA: hypothetical protein VN763_04010, partial [Saprospiraceae bacterium]|nr:hypothetical protein [Saprospiraceae bacterium]
EVVFPGPDQEVYFRTTQNDLYRYDHTGVKKLLHMNFRSDPRKQDYHYIDDAIFFQSGYSDTVLQWTGEGQFVTSIVLPSQAKNPEQHMVWNYKGKASDGGRIFEGYEEDSIRFSLFELYPNGVFQKKIDFKVRNLPAVYLDPYRNILWIQSKDDFFSFDPVTGERLGESIYQPLVSFSLLVGKDGQLWKGTQNGLYNFKRKPTYFTAVNMPDFDNQSSRGITGDASNTIYVLTYGGCYKFYPKSGKTEPWIFPRSITGIAATTDHEGNIWSTLEEGEIYKYNPRTNSFVVSHLHHPGFISTWDIMELSTGDLGIGTTEGLWLKQPKDTFAMFKFMGSTDHK